MVGSSQGLRAEGGVEYKGRQGTGGGGAPELFYGIMGVVI